MDAGFVPKLNNTVGIREFDTSNKDQKYILYSKKTQWQISELLYNVIILINGKRNLEEITSELSNKIDNNISINDISSIFDNFLIKRGILEGFEDKIKCKNNKSSYLWCKLIIINSKKIEKFKFLTKLYDPKIIIISLLMCLVPDLIIFLKTINLTTYLQMINLNNLGLPYMVLILFVGNLLHELGHMTACMRFNVKPGNIGIAIYLTNPVFYADVNDTWRLKRNERVIVDIGGMYFQFLFVSIVTLTGKIIHNELLISGSFVCTILLLNNLNPFLKLDGYWIVSDFIGVPNLHHKVKEYYSYLIYKLFRLRGKCCIDEIQLKDRLIFKLYCYCSIIFIILFTVSIYTLIVGLANIPFELINLFTFQSEGYTQIKTIEYVFISIFKLFLILVFIISLFRMVWVTVNGAFRFILSIIAKYDRQH